MTDKTKKSQTQDKIQRIIEQEKNWLNNVHEYLGVKDNKSMPAENTFPGKYRKYNSIRRAQLEDGNRKDLLMLNDIYFSIPPTNINVMMNENSIDLPQIRSKHSVKINTGHGEIAVSMDLVFTDNPIDKGAGDGFEFTLENEINYCLLPLLTQLRMMPFVHAENEYLRGRLVAAAEAVSGQKLEVLDTSTKIMLSYVSHSISTVGESDRIIQLSLNFLLFNYYPYVSRIAYTSAYMVKDDALARNPKNNFLIPDGLVYKPSDSLAFYEFYALEYQRLETLLNKKYNHRNHDDNLILTYNTYTAIDRSSVDDKYKSQLNAAVENIKTGGTNISSVVLDYAPIRLNEIIKQRLKKWDTFITAASKTHGVDANLIKAVISQESSGNAKAESAAGAKGLMQIMPATFASEGGTNIMDPADSINIGTKYLSKLIKRFNNRIPSALAAYNAGPGAVKAYLEGISLPVRHNGKITHIINPTKIKTADGIPPYAETRKYVKNVIGCYKTYTGNTNAISAPPHSDIQSSVDKRDTQKADRRQSAPGKTDVSKYLDSLPKDTWEFVVTEKDSSTVYIRQRHSLNCNMGGENDSIKILSIENTGENDIPRIPIAGYKYPTHQFMGGHIEKIQIVIHVLDQTGEHVLSQIQNIMSIVAENNLRFKHICYMDGIGLNNDFINAITASDNFVFDNISIQTDQNIPGASIVTISMTDYSRVREHILKAFSFRFDERKHESAFYKSFIQEIFEVTQPKIVKTTVKTGGSKDAAGIKRKEVTGSPLQIESSGKSYKYIHRSEIYNAAIDQLFFKINTVLLSCSLLGKSATQDDLYDIRKYLALNGNDPKDDIYSQIFPGGSSSELNYILKSFVNSYGQKLIMPDGKVSKYYLPKTVGSYGDILKEMESLTMPAYLDFDLPPTIDPDYYFYQPQKIGSVKAKNEILDKQIESIGKDANNRWRKYQDQLTVMKIAPNKNGTFDDLNNNILYQMFGNDKDVYNNLRFPAEKEEDRYSLVGQNISNIAADVVDDNALKKKCLIDDADRAEQIYKSVKTVEKQSPETIGTYIINNAMNRANQQFLFYQDDENFLTTLFYASAQYNTVSSQIMSLAYAFPVYKIFLIEEDDTEKAAPLRADLNDYYGLNAIQEIRLVQNSDQPIDVLTVKFLDITGRFTSARFKEMPFQENKGHDVRDTKKENNLDGVMIKDGTRIQFRAGYSNNVNQLETMFNGQVANISGDLGEYEMICQSFGAELVFDRKSPKSPLQPLSILYPNAYTKALLTWAISQPEIKHFGRWKLHDVSNSQFSSGDGGLNFFGAYYKQRPDGKEQFIWTFSKDESDMNILAPEESIFMGAEALMREWADDFLGNLWHWLTDGVPVLSGTIRFLRSIFTTYVVYNQTPWDVIDEMTYRYPGYVAKVLPFDDRNTLFYGPPTAPYYYRSWNLSEKLAVKNFMQTKGKDYENAVKIVDDAIEILKSPVTDIKGNDLRSIFPSINENDFNNYKEAYHKFSKIINEGSSFRRNTVRIFRQYWTANSESTIIANNIKADYRDVYTEAKVTYSKPDPQYLIDKDSYDKQVWFNDIVSVRMNDFLLDEDIRSTTISYPNCIDKDTSWGGAYRYGTQELWRQSKKLYKGNLAIIGEPRMKPYDIVLVNDDSSDMYGPIEVRQHVFSIVPGEGMISSITPGMVSFINNITQMGLLDTISFFLSGKRTQDTAERFAGGIAPLALTGGTAYTVGKMVVGAAVGGVLSAGSYVTLAATAAALSSLAMKSLYAAKFRESILLHPLMRNGIPYMVGMNHYKTGTMIEWIENEWQLFTKGLDTAVNVLDSARLDILTKYVDHL